MVGNTRWTQGQVHCETGFASGRICTNQLWRRTHHQAAAWFALLVSHQLYKICTPSLSFCTFWCKKCLHQMLHKLARCQNWKMFVSFLTFYKQPVQQRCSQKILQQPSQRRSSAPILDCSMICSFWHKRRNQPYTAEKTLTEFTLQYDLHYGASQYARVVLQWQAKARPCAAQFAHWQCHWIARFVNIKFCARAVHCNLEGVHPAKAHRA